MVGELLTFRPQSCLPIALPPAADTACRPRLLAQAEEGRRLVRLADFFQAEEMLRACDRALAAAAAPELGWAADRAPPPAEALVEWCSLASQVGGAVGPSLFLSTAEPGGPALPPLVLSS